jgi:7-cyano-7-deazaguanine synthase in queuosine biosynthesis
VNGNHLIWCGPDVPPRDIEKKYGRVIKLNTFPGKGNVNLKFENISTRLAQNIPLLAMDLLEISSYVYCADQSVSRGGKTWPQDGKKWIRNFVLKIPVRNIDVWNDENIKEQLSETLGFLSDDNYEFDFRECVRDIPTDQYFDFDQGLPWFEADSILLYSGGLDSTAGMIDEAVNNNQKVVLVSHRSAPQISKRQLDLLKQFRYLSNSSKKLLHIPVWVNKDPGLTKDFNQRTRSFLYASLAACVAFIHKLNTIKIYENGIISTNLPISEQLVGARASRSTHPKVLSGLSKLFSTVFDSEFRVENPFFWKTKSDIVKVIKDSGLSRLIQSTNSCSHTRATNIAHPHCGVCSQCIERRLAILYNGLEEDDPEEKYKIRLFKDPLEKREAKRMVDSYFRHAMFLEEAPQDQFFARFSEVSRIFDHVSLKTSEAAKKIHETHRRHGRQVGEVTARQIELNIDNLRLKKIPPNSLLSMLVSQPLRKKIESGTVSFPTPGGTRWEDITIEIISKDSARIKIDGLVKTYTAIDMGFRDGRRGDMLNKQWDLLVSLAEHDGTLSWKSGDGGSVIYKKMQRLKDTLKEFFQLQDPPIRTYDKKKGYKTRFTISDKTYGN